MSKILVMDTNLANKIAAGEVVEKCMNVVKELVENSIDAKATHISIDLIDSGVKEIKVSDDGIGMDKEDALLCFERHATSKLKKEYDLFHINSLGFRGEALPSIASVSKLTLRTCDGKTSTEVEIDGGKIINVGSCDLDKGTVIKVENLFYNTPVRLKYLKSLYTELSYITDYVDKMALSYPNISFSLTNNDKLLLKTDGSNRLLKVINDIYGLSVTKKMLEVSDSNDDYEISGYISYPELQKSTKNSITILVNGRVIKNNDIIRYISETYHDYIPKDKYPICVLKIEVDPVLIDVNVHPTKLDIKFSKMDTLKDLIVSMIRKKLDSISLIPDASLETIYTEEKVKISTVYTDKQFQDFDEVKKENEYKEIEEIKLNFDVSEDNEIIEEEGERLKKMYPVGVVHGTFIVAQNEDGMYLIDQHAANERINYEYFLKEMGNPNRAVTDLLIPINIEYSNSDFLILKENLNVFDELGIGYEPFGLNTLMIRSIPLWLNNSHTEELIKSISEIIISEREFNLTRFREKLAAMAACKASIRANENITLKDMEILIDRLRECKNPFTCAHGRPCIISYSRYDLDKLFKRTLC